MWTPALENFFFPFYKVFSEEKLQEPLRALVGLGFTASLHVSVHYTGCCMWSPCQGTLVIHRALQVLPYEDWCPHLPVRIRFHLPRTGSFKANPLHSVLFRSHVSL